jgi:hypothetical protein
MSRNTRRLNFLRLLVPFAGLLCWPVQASLASDPITAEGQLLVKALDDMDVEHLWLARRRVHWKTGDPYGPPPTDGKPHTHCSAFVAAFCQRHDIYILRPPEHSETLLANAQYDWLENKGTDAGWKPAAGPVEAQQLANQGMVVVAVYKESDPRRHGHIAIIRPSTRSQDSILANGPQVTQAGMDNFKSASLKTGFQHHRTAWVSGQIRYYAHEVKWAKTP